MPEITKPEREACETCETLAPFLRAGMTGMRRARWGPDLPAEWLVAPIVLAVLVKVAKNLPLAEMTAALDRQTERGGDLTAHLSVHLETQ